MCVLLNTNNISRKKIDISIEQHKKAFLLRYFEKVHQLDEMMIANGNIRNTASYIVLSYLGMAHEDFQIMSDKWAACVFVILYLNYDNMNCVYESYHLTGG